MVVEIKKKYSQESILYKFIREEILDWGIIEEFRNIAINTIKYPYDNEYQIRYDNFVDNPSIFLKPKWGDSINMGEFIEVIKGIEAFYNEKISDFTRFRYYQYITLLITFIFCKIHNNKIFKEEYLQYIANNVFTNESEFDPYLHKDSTFNRLGYWMATACGKTLLMYAISYMYIKLISPNTQTLYVIVPGDELRSQHANFLEKFYGSGLDAKNYKFLDIKDLRLFNDVHVNVKLTTLSKMLSDEKVDKNSVSANSGGLASNSLMIFDEAHKGAANDTATEKLKKIFMLKENNFLLEFSATFQDAFEEDEKKLKKITFEERNIFDWYLFSGIMKYNLYDFNADGFGKSYYVMNLGKSGDKRNKSKVDLICDSIVHYGLQLYAYETIKQEDPNFEDYGTFIQHRDGTRLYKPLYMGLSWKLENEKGEVDKESGTTLVEILGNFMEIISNYGKYIDNINKSISFLYLDELKFKGSIDPRKLFKLLTGEDYAEGNILTPKIWYDKQSDEIKILIGNKRLLVNTSDNSHLAESLNDVISTKFSLQDQYGTGGRWFNNIDKDSEILYVFGSRKFIEGWDSKRPSTIMLFKMGKRSTILATQILGRGLRLAGRNGDGYRHICNRLKYNPSRHHQSHITEYVGLFGYEIDEFKDFIDLISGEILNVTIHKKREFTVSFSNYLKNAGVDIDNEIAINNFMKDIFKYKYQKIEPNDELQEGVKLSVDFSNGSNVDFYLEWPGGKKSAGAIYHENKLLYSTTTGLLSQGEGSEGEGKTKVEYIYYGNEIIGERGIKLLTNRLHSIYQNWGLSDEDRENIEKRLQTIVIETNHFSDNDVKGEGNIFNIGLQNDIVSTFTTYIEEIFEKIDNNIKSVKTKRIENKDGVLGGDNFIKDLTINIGIKKNDDGFENMQKLFDIDKSKNRYEENYEDLNDEQKKVFDPLLKTKIDDDLHFYERLYYISSPARLEEDRTQNLPHHLEERIFVNGSKLDLHYTKSEPNDLLLIYNEESRIKWILFDISKNEKFKKYDIFYLRNLTSASNGGIKFAYLDESGTFKYFFPDFLFWFIDKETKETTVVYFEPKSSIDENWQRKQKVLNEVVGNDVDDCIKELFDTASGANKAGGKETFWGGMRI